MKKTIPLLAILMAELCLATPLAAATARTATENFVTNKIAAAISQIPPPDYSTNNTALVETIEAKAPTPDLSPFLRNDGGAADIQEFGGVLYGRYWANSWSDYTAVNGRVIMQTLPAYIESNPWGFALTNDFVRKSGDVMTGSLTIAYDENLLSIYPDSIYFSGATGVNYIYYPDNIYGHGEIGYGDLHYRGGFDIFATREWADHRAHATVSNIVTAAYINELAPAPGDYAAVSNAAMNALSRNGGTVTLSNGVFAVGYDDYGRVAGFVPCIAVDTTGVDPIITIGDDYAGHGGAGETYFRNPVRFKDYASVDFEHGFTTYGDRGDHEVYVNGQPQYVDYALVTDITPAISNAVPAWALAAQKPTYTASEVGATSPTAVSNIVTTALVRERLGVYLYVGEDGGIYVHTNED